MSYRKHSSSVTVAAQSASGMLITNARYKSTRLITRSRKGPRHDMAWTLWYLAVIYTTYNIHCHDQLRPYNYGKRSDSRAPFSSYYDIYNRKVAKLYQQTTCMYLSKSRALQRNAELIPRLLSGSRSARDQGTSSSVKVSHYRSDWNIPWTHVLSPSRSNERYKRSLLAHTGNNKGEKLGLRCGLINDSVFNEGQFPSSSAFCSYVRWSFGSRAN